MYLVKRGRTIVATFESYRAAVTYARKHGRCFVQYIPE